MHVKTYLVVAVLLFGLSFGAHLFALLFGPRQHDHETRGLLALAMAVWGCFVLGVSW